MLSTAGLSGAQATNTELHRLLLVKRQNHASLIHYYGILHVINNSVIHCESKKLGHFYFYCNFGKCWSFAKVTVKIKVAQFFDSQCITEFRPKINNIYEFILLQLKHLNIVSLNVL